MPATAEKDWEEMLSNGEIKAAVRFTAHAVNFELEFMIKMPAVLT